LGGLAGISETYYEAARIDGSSPWQSFRFITLPLLVPTITVVSIASFIGAFQVFDLVLVLTGGGPGRSSTPIVQYLYQQGFQSFNMGYASSLSVLLFLVILSLSIFQFRLSEYLRDH
jgi:multiple sugar transport system permease protein